MTAATDDTPVSTPGAATSVGTAPAAPDLAAPNPAAPSPAASPGPSASDGSSASGAPRVRMRPEILALAAYRQGRPAPTDAFKLSSNENPFAPIPAVLEAIAASSVNRYPDGAATAVRERLADRHGVGAHRVHAGAGSVSILSQLIQAAAGPGDEVVYAWRSFEAYPGLIVVAGASGVPVPLTATSEHDLPAMAAAITHRTRLVIVCSPNNPTGTTVTDADFAEFMASVPSDVLVVLDEAYAEFVTDPEAVDGMRLLDRHPNLVVLRTFSKAYGLAGLRFGYAIGPDYVLDAARTAAIPLSVIEPAQRAAIAALDHEGELLERVARLSTLRDDVRAELLTLGWNVPAAQGNFVWLATGAQTANAAETFLRHGVVTRPLGDDGLRVSIGEAESAPGLLAAAAEVLAALPTGHPARRSDPDRDGDPEYGGTDGYGAEPEIPHGHRVGDAPAPAPAPATAPLTPAHRAATPEAGA